MIYTPHEYGRYCTDRIIHDPYIGLFLDMGLGKTVITLTAILTLRFYMWSISKVLIIAPKKVAEATWQKEAAKWDHLKPLRIQTVLGSKQQRVRALHSASDIWIINRDNVEWLVDYYLNELQQPWPFDMVILDESSSFKNHRAKRFTSLRSVRPRINRLVELTGTPAPNGLIDLWAQVFLLDRGERLEKTISAFRERYFNPDKRNQTTVFSYALKTGAEEAIRQRISDICVSMKAEDYLTLPECIFDDIPVVLDAKAQKLYEKLERDELLLIDADTVVRGQAAVLTNKLLQMCNGSAYTDDGTVAEIHTCKIEAFMELVEQLHGEHALVFYAYNHDLQILLPALAKTGLRVRIYKGPEDDTAWNAGEVDILLAHPASCAYGLNLQDGGHHAIWFGLTWNLELYQQANKRLHRQGQQYPVIVHHLLTQGGVDEDVMTALTAKGDTQEALMQALKARIEKVKKEGNS
jgi:SNF2 family DNA or RNA helicase